MAQTWQNAADSDGYYDLAQLNKRLEWLDAERRKDKDMISLMAEQISRLQSENLTMRSELKQLEDEIAVYSPVFGRIEQIDAQITQNRGELARVIEENRKAHTDKESELATAQQNAQESLSRAILGLRKQIEPIADIRKSVQARMDEIYTLTRVTEELGHRIDKVALERDDFLRFQKTNEESRKQDTKRLADMQGELNAYRKRNEEMRTKVDLSSETVKKLEQRVTEIQGGDAERRQIMSNFIEKQNQSELAREKTLAEWKESFDGIVEKAATLENQAQALDAIRRSVKRSQDTLDESAARFDRRTNEITEMQRLMEERFRQEWSTFKSDDQKRWMNYTLGQDEIQSEYKRNTEMLTNRLNKLEDTAVSSYDENAQREETHTRQLQELYALLRGWLEQGN